MFKHKAKAVDTQEASVILNMFKHRAVDIQAASTSLNMFTRPDRSKIKH
jgi:hypothetical protein